MVPYILLTVCAALISFSYVTWRKMSGIYDSLRCGELLCSWQVSQLQMHEHVQVLNDIRQNVVYTVDPRVTDYADIIHAIHLQMDNCMKVMKRCADACDAIRACDCISEHELQLWWQSLLAVEKECRKNVLQQLRIERSVYRYDEHRKKLRFIASKIKIQQMGTGEHELAATL